MAIQDPISDCYPACAETKETYEAPQDENDDNQSLVSTEDDDTCDAFSDLGSCSCDECAGNNEEDGPDHSQFSLVRVCITTVITFILILSTMASFNAIINTQTIHGEQMIGVSDLVFLLLSIVSHCATFAILAIFRGGEDSQNKAHTRACLVRYYCNLSTLIFLLSLLNTKWYWERSSDLQTQGFEEYFYRCRIASTWQIGIFGMITLLLWIRYRTLYDPEQVCLSCFRLAMSPFVWDH